eukprot:m.60236 g.60236  ORF g.60236 m.60236 type:complete len:530 (-) comp49319_c0_seq10:98-1687(-)
MMSAQVPWRNTTPGAACRPTVGGECVTNICSDCPAYASCPGNNQVSSIDGYWRCRTLETGSSGTTIVTYSMEQCVDGFCLANNLCGQNRDADYDNNPLCGKCASGYARLGPDCTEASNFGGGYWVLWLVVNWCLCLLILASAASQLASKIKILLYFFQTLIIVSGPINAVFPVIQLFSLSLANSIPLVTSTTSYLTVQLVNPVMFPVLLLVTFGVAKLLSLCKHDTGAVDPEATLNDGSFDRCMEAFDGFFHFCQNGIPAHGHRTDEPKVQALRKKNMFFRAFLFILHAGYETLTDQALVLLHCVHACHVGSVLEEYPDVPCAGATYQNFQGIAVTILILISFAFPAFLSVLLWRNSQKHNEDSFLARWGVFYDHYKPSLYWWQIQEYLRRLLLLLGYVFIHDHLMKYYFVAIVCLLILAVHALFMPFRHGVDNFFESLSLVVLSYAAIARVAEMTDSDRVLRVLLFLTLAILFVLTFLEIFLKYFHHPLKRLFDRVARGREGRQQAVDTRERLASTNYAEASYVESRA